MRVQTSKQYKSYYKEILRAISAYFILKDGEKLFKPQLAISTKSWNRRCKTTTDRLTAKNTSKEREKRVQSGVCDGRVWKSLSECGGVKYVYFLSRSLFLWSTVLYFTFSIYKACTFQYVYYYHNNATKLKEPATSPVNKNKNKILFHTFKF